MPETTFQLKVPAILRRIGDLMNDRTLSYAQCDMAQEALTAAVREYVYALPSNHYKELADAAYLIGFDTRTMDRVCEILEAFACRVFELEPRYSGYDLADGGLTLLWDDGHISECDEDDLPPIQLVVNVIRPAAPGSWQDMVAQVVAHGGHEPDVTDHFDGSLDLLFYFETHAEAEALGKKLIELDCVNAVGVFHPEAEG
jgi:hypothetical protein